MINKKAFIKLERVISPEYILRKNAGMQELAADLKRAVTRAGTRGARVMREVILDSPTGNPRHIQRNITRERTRPPIAGKDGSVNNSWGSRLETGNMYNSVSFKRGKKVPGADARFKQDIIGGFGWPADAAGNIKDAPGSPMSRSRQPDTTNWRSDPRYFAMQEYGFGDTPGMNSQEKASEAASQKLREEIEALKRKYK